MYADVEHDEDAVHAGKVTRMLKQALADYQLYKNGGQEEAKYPPALTGKKYDFPYLGIIFGYLDYQMKTKLQYVNIFFKSPTFDRITKDAKTNFVTKISVLGGTLGLFAGFSLFSGVEIAYFLVTSGYQLGTKSM